jgi:hypothetical protein
MISLLTSEESNVNGRLADFDWAHFISSFQLPSAHGVKTLNRSPDKGASMLPTPVLRTFQEHPSFTESGRADVEMELLAEPKPGALRLQTVCHLVQPTYVTWPLCPFLLLLNALSSPDVPQGCFFCVRRPYHRKPLRSLLWCILTRWIITSSSLAVKGAWELDPGKKIHQYCSCMARAHGPPSFLPLLPCSFSLNGIMLPLTCDNPTKVIRFLSGTAGVDFSSHVRGILISIRSSHKPCQPLFPSTNRAPALSEMAHPAQLVYRQPLGCRMGSVGANKQRPFLLFLGGVA